MPKGNGTSRPTTPDIVRPRPISSGAKPEALEKNKVELEKYMPPAMAPVVWAMASPRTVLSAGNIRDRKALYFDLRSGRGTSIIATVLFVCVWLWFKQKAVQLNSAGQQFISGADYFFQHIK
jgi:hypothetical protein